MSRPPSTPSELSSTSVVKPKILLVDDEAELLVVLARALSKEGYDVGTYGSATAALDCLRAEANAVRAVIADVHMPELSGMALLEEIRESWPTIPVVLMTGESAASTAVEALRKGAYDYLLKPFDLQQDLFPVARRAVEYCLLQRRNRYLEHQLDQSVPTDHIVGESEGILGVLSLLPSIGRTDATVLLLGESGTGKELVARAIHAHSPRCRKPFVAINCASFTESLLESELFGHVRGAFTGAVRAHRGLFEQASQGTLFLDEIAELSPAIQARFLRVLEEGQVRPVGSDEARPVDVRIIAATHRDLKALAKEGVFRQDLFFRINVIPLPLPPLRERKDDIPLLARHFVEEHAVRLGTAAKSIDDRALAALAAYDWPGNVRELENVIERALVMSTADTIELGDLPRSLPPPARPAVAASDDPLLGYAEAKEAFELTYLSQVLATANGNLAAAARLAKTDRSNFRRLLKRAGLDARSPADRAPKLGDDAPSSRSRGKPNG
jgi:DNA-binding NtrC family response regulator